MKINIEQSFDQISDYWSPKVISRVNDQYVKITKVKGEFTWHNHKDEDELFLVVRGRLLIQLEGEEIELNAGDMYVVPKGAMHNPVAHEECWVMLVESNNKAHRRRRYTNDQVDRRAACVIECLRDYFELRNSDLMSSQLLPA